MTGDRGPEPMRRRLRATGTSGAGVAEVAVLLGVLALGLAAGLVLMRGAGATERAAVVRPW